MTESGRDCETGRPMVGSSSMGRFKSATRPFCFKAETFFTRIMVPPPVTAEYCGEGEFRSGLDFFIEIDEGASKPCRKNAADGGFAAPRHA